jgi:hypothetical protein
MIRRVRLSEEIDKRLVRNESHSLFEQSEILNDGSKERYIPLGDTIELPGDPESQVSTTRLAAIQWRVDIYIVTHVPFVIFLTRRHVFESTRIRDILVVNGHLPRNNFTL